MLFAGHYHLKRELGRGGMARVFEADDLERGARVAIKVLDLVVEDGSLRSRFFNELLLTSSIAHPNIVNILDFGVVGRRKRPFLVMDLLNGVDLGEHIAQTGPVAPRELLELFDGVIDALAELHARGIIHKDIKPSNLFLHHPPGEEPRLMLMDFGIAHSLDLHRSTDPSLLACTPHYGSPEYFQHQLVSPALDVYQMTLVFLEALVGWSMVGTSSLMACIQAHIDGDLRIPPLLRHGPLADLIAGGLATDPTERLPNGEALHATVSAIDPEALTISMEMMGHLDALPRGR